MSSTGTILDRIMARKREEVAERRQRVSETHLLDRVRQQRPPRSFHDALADRVTQQQPAIIAEIKRASPSKGRIHPGDGPFDAVAIARGYADHGATCLSCLTDRDFFQGDDDFVVQIGDQVALPLLRKEFIYDPYQVIETRALGADAILLILAVLSRQQAAELEAAAHELGLEVLIEVHDEAELDAAHELSSPLIGINNRNLRTFETTLTTSTRLAGRAATDRLLVAESGIHSADDLRQLRASGLHAFLIGETFMRHDDPGQALATLIAAVNGKAGQQP
ncbi:MAG: indole-3-glycerol phosphate synthase TrpC [Magnetococcales bacterium]|nr:indole-3-glycerol phosphate synthase TrpC [Magnetococcales bacterium]